MQPLPIDPFLPALVAALRDEPSLVLVAEPGAGKTTRVPRALLDAGFAAEGEIVVLEPRRIAARMAARRVAEELGEPLGRRVGYQVRLEEVASADTRVRFVTEGVLTRRLVADRGLPGVAAVVLDELHERHLQGDLALSLLRKLQREQRPELRLVAMSATLDAEPVARLLEAAILRVPGRTFEVAIEHETQRDERRLEARIVSALRRLLDAGLDGDVLVFLPGAAEIRRAREAVEPLAKQAGLEVALLHGDLAPEEQDRAVRPGARRKVILSTNVAESSLTIEGVSAVIDSGLARMAGHSPWSGLPTLETAKISRASATQRAGRAGRVRAGRCIRLYDKHDHDGRPAYDKPEIARADLADTLLAVKASAGVLAASEWLDPPPAQAWAAAHALCERLGALDAQGAISELGLRMLRIPLHPRLSRVLLEAAARGASERGALLAALLSERDIVLGARARFDDRARDVEAGPSDALDRLERFEDAERQGLDAGTLRRHELDSGAVHAVKRTRDRLLRSLPRSRASGPALDDEPLSMALLAGFSDRVGKRRSKSSSDFVLAGGGAVTQSPGSVVRDAELCVVLDAQQSPRGVVAHLLSAIEPEHLLELFPERVQDRTRVRFDAQTERVLALHEVCYEGLVLDSSRVADPSGPEVEQALYEAAATRGVQAFDDAEAIEHFVQRWAHAAKLDARVPSPPESAGLAALRAACEGHKSLAELRTAGLMASLRALCPGPAAALLERLCPEQVELGSGRRLRVHYEPDRPPWVESRLQDFFGLRHGPRLGDQPLVLHLLAPNQRALQVTTDLAGFWQRHYPELRRQLMRRYPRHSWPDDPLTALPPAPKR